jgi:O-antigen ligase
MTTEKLLVSLILILPLQFALNASANADLVITRVFVPIIFLLWLARGLAKKKVYIKNSSETWLLLLFLLFSALSLLWAAHPPLGTRRLLYLLSLAPVYFVAADILQENRWKNNILRAIFFSGLLAALVALGQFALQFFLGIEKTVALWSKLAKIFLGTSFSEVVAANSSWLVNISGKTVMRAFGFFPDPHMFSFFVSMCLLILLGYIVSEKNKKWKKYILAGSSLMFLALILSFARGAYVGIIAAGIFFLVVYFGRSGNFKKLFIAVSVLAVVVMVFFLGPIKSRLSSVFDIQEGSNSERILNWKQALGFISGHPLAGVGLGNYSHSVDPLSQERSSIYAHNIFLDISAEAGLLTGLIFLMLLLATFLKAIASKNAVGVGTASAMLYFAVHGIFDAPIYSPQVFILLLVLFALGANFNSKKSITVSINGEGNK